MAKVSVIIPVYNVEKYLRECLDSVVNQTLQDIEIICVDDGGKDKCPQIIDEYAKNDERITVIHKENGGYGQSCNVGLEKASGEYVAILEPDDYIAPNMYEDLFEAAIKNNADIVRSNYIDNFDIEGNRFQKTNSNFTIDKPQTAFTLKEFPMLMYTHPSIWSCIFKRDFLNKNNIRFVEAPGAGWTDNPFQVQTMCLAKRIFYIDKAYYYWRRVNLHSEDDLKDFRIPFKRTTEIHQWLKDNNVDDEGILSYLYKREICYFKIINKVLKKKDIPEYLNLVQKYFQTVNISFVENSTILKPSEKLFLKLLKRNPLKIVIKIKLKLLK